MKTIKLVTTVILSLTLLFTSCNEDDVSAPAIRNLEIGLENNHIGYIGNELHLEADIEASGIIDEVTVTINHKTIGNNTIKASYTEFAGLKNTLFHEHIDIPDGSEAGTYILDFIVTDQAGRQTIIQEEIEIEITTETQAPEITIASVPSENKIFQKNDTIIISGTVTDNHSLGGIYIGLVRENQNLNDENIGDSNTITILHTHDFENSQSFNFTAKLVTGSEQDNNTTPKIITNNLAWQSGNYFIVVKSQDVSGNWAFSDRYPIIIKMD
ncbi:DUF4625 domain-containing protein [Geofilum sp. OHC36d9]|uniref:DUF4625 domain-containing protein n=1 Tax=Geofilum sp. OHC36d9 TaxID=3458413 RepID=UPI004034B3FE